VQYVWYFIIIFDINVRLYAYIWSALYKFSRITFYLRIEDS
jgi:hypothetical protein